MNNIVKKTSFWIFTSFVLVIALFLVSFSKGDFDKVAINEVAINEFKSEEEIGSFIVNYINDSFFQGTDSVSLINVFKESGIYKLDLMLEGEEITVYTTKDGKLFFPEGFVTESLEEELIEDNEEIGELIDCLEESNFVIYGADWCPYCRDVVNLFKGHQKIDSIYVECTENEDLCSEKEITGYPTILISDQPYTGNRTLEGFALETNCN